jgi:hypothetical protein
MRIFEKNENILNKVGLQASAGSYRSCSAPAGTAKNVTENSQKSLMINFISGYPIVNEAI